MNKTAKVVLGGRAHPARLQDFRVQIFENELPANKKPGTRAGLRISVLEVLTISALKRKVFAYFAFAMMVSNGL